MRQLEVLEPQTIEEACSLLSKYKEEARLIAGGQSLVPILEQRLASPKYLINIKGLPGLDYIKEDGNSLKIGAGTTERALEKSSIIKQKFPILAEAARSIGCVEIRNWGTIGGSLAQSDPAGDLAPALIALRATVEAAKAKGKRQIPLEKFSVDYFQSELEEDEILTEISVPYLPPRSGGVYLKETVTAMSTGMTTLAVVVNLGGKDEVKEARIVLGSQAAVPIRAVKTEKLAVGKKLGDSTKDLEASIAQEARPVADASASVAYKVELARVMLRHALPIAINRAKAG